MVLAPMAASAGPPWWVTLVWFVVSGAIGVGWALTGFGRRWLLIPTLAVQMLAVSVLSGVIPTPLHLRASGISLHGFGSVVLIASGYACFVAFIRSQGVSALRLVAEMDLAAGIHQRLVPPVALRSGFAEAVGRSLPSGAMGGDLVEAAMLPDGAMEVFVADVSGHGVRAGVIMAMIKATLHGRRSRGAIDSPGEVLAELNRVLVELTDPNDFATAAIVRLRPDGTAECALAGHPPILHRRGGEVELIEEGGLPLGIVAEERYPCRTVAIGEGDLLVLYSDGLTETEVAPGKLLDVEGLAEIVRGAAAERTGDLATAIIDGVAARATSAEAIDDRSILVVRMVGKVRSATRVHDGAGSAVPAPTRAASGAGP